MVDLISLAIVVTLGMLILALATVFWRNHKDHKPDYSSFYILGFVFFLMGMGANNIALYVLGLIFLLVGLANSQKLNKRF